MSLLRTMPLSTHGTQSLIASHTVDIPAGCCPVSKNPKKGSFLTLRYAPSTCTIEVYSLRKLTQQFVGGFAAQEGYPEERNMEGLCELVARIASDVLGVDVEFDAHILLDCGEMSLSGKAVAR